MMETRTRVNLFLTGGWIGACLLLCTTNWEEGVDPGRILDASQFPSLQAAIDALPPAGGVIHLTLGSLRVSCCEPTTEGFTINLGSPPGKGNCVAVDWHVIR